MNFNLMIGIMMHQTTKIGILYQIFMHRGCIRFYVTKGSIPAGIFVKHICNEHAFANTDYFHVKHYPIMFAI